MITKTQAFQTSDNKTHASLEEAQKWEIAILGEATQLAAVGNNREEVAKWILANAPKLLDILTTKSTSKPRARKVNGGTKKRTPTTPPAP